MYICNHAPIIVLVHLSPVRSLSVRIAPVLLRFPRLGGVSRRLKEKCVVIELQRLSPLGNNRGVAAVQIGV